MANLNNTDFLKFSAYSIKELITRKLSEDSKFTDQVYEGSNLAIMIDIFSYMAQCLLYSLNNSASESMFADTQLYENIVRLTKFIGYNPKGATASIMGLYVNNISNQSIRSYWIPPYSRIDTGLTDVLGKKVYFSTACNDVNSTNGSPILLEDSNQQKITLYNGQWKMYSTVFTASGFENETFILDGIQSDSQNKTYVAQDFIDIYVQHFDDSIGDWTFGNDSWTMDKNGIFTGYSSDNNSQRTFNNQTAFKSLYPGTYPVYSVYLNEDKNYVLRFGNGIVGKKLSPGDKIYIFYLDTNGPDGKIDMTDFDVTKLKFQHSPSMFGLSEKLYNEIFKLQSDTHSYDREYSLANEKNQSLYQLSYMTQNTTTPSVEETVEEIKTNAPQWFTTGNRLVTRFDYEYYLKNTRNSSSIIGCDIVDVKCMNNWEYMASYYRWLYNLSGNGKLVENGIRESENSYYLNKSRFVRTDYFYADSSDACNLYMWIKAATDDFDTAYVTQNLNECLRPIKLMTSELIACKAVNVCFDICAAPIEYVLQKYISKKEDGLGLNDHFESYIEVTLDDNSIYVASSMQKQIYNIIVNSFSINSCRLGQPIQFDEILNQIYQIDGIYKVRTIFNPTDSDMKPRTYDGLSFASWSNAKGLIDIGDDLNVSNTIRQLEDFQFPVFVGQNSLMNQIKIIKKSLSNINTIKF